MLIEGRWRSLLLVTSLLELQSAFLRPDGKTGIREEKADVTGLAASPKPPGPLVKVRAAQHWKTPQGSAGSTDSGAGHRVRG